MLFNIIFLLLILIFIILAVKLKITQQQKRTEFAKIPEEVRLSPFSKALAELVAIAGGIYISLSVLTSFLSLSIPERVQLADNLQIDPLAMLAVIISIVQPIVLKLFKN